MAFVPQNQKQQEAFDFATQLSNLLNQGIENGLLTPTLAKSFASGERFIYETDRSYAYTGPNGEDAASVPSYNHKERIQPAIPEIVKL